MTNVDRVIYAGCSSNSFYLERGHRGPWQDLQKLFRNVFVKIKLKCEKKISHVSIQC